MSKALSTTHAVQKKAILHDVFVHNSQEGRRVRPRRKVARPPMPIAAPRDHSFARMVLGILVAVPLLAGATVYLSSSAGIRGAFATAATTMASVPSPLLQSRKGADRLLPMYSGEPPAATIAVAERAVDDAADDGVDHAVHPDTVLPTASGVEPVSRSPGSGGFAGSVVTVGDRPAENNEPAAREPLFAAHVTPLIEHRHDVTLAAGTGVPERAPIVVAGGVAEGSDGAPSAEPPAFDTLLPEALAAQLALPQDYSALFQETDVRLASLFGLEVRTVVLDPGHGGRDPGARGPGGLVEKDVTLDIAKRLRDRLARRRSFKVLLTRDRDEKVTLRRRVDFANSHAADVLVSIHVNYLPQEPPTIVETYYFGPQSDEAALELARVENQGSEYSMGAFNKMINRIGDTFRHQESRTLARAIQGSLYRNLRSHNKRIQNVGIKTAPFVVLLGVEMPSVLAEVTCISNREEERRLATPKYRERIAAYLEEGIVGYLRDRHRAHDTTETRVRNDGESTEQGG